MKSARMPYFEGWPLVAVISLPLAVAVLGAPAAEGGTEGIRVAVRATAWTSLALFLSAFWASSLMRLLPGAWSKWQLRNRRYLGVSFAVSHFIHAGALVALYVSDAALFWTLTAPGNVVAGGLAYVFIVLMTATSFDRTAAWLGRRRWLALHKTGVWYIWIVFMVGFGKRIPTGDRYVLPVVLLVLAAALRLVAWWIARRPRAAVQPTAA